VFLTTGFDGVADGAAQRKTFHGHFVEHPWRVDVVGLGGNLERGVALPGEGNRGAMGGSDAAQ
jgi:hypothetical protein